MSKHNSVSTPKNIQKLEEFNLFMLDYGELEEILVSYKIGRITLDEAKRAIKSIYRKLI